MKQLQILILTYIKMTIKDLDVTTASLIDTGSEITFFQDFLVPKWEKLSSDKRLKLKVFVLLQLI